VAGVAMRPSSVVLSVLLCASCYTTRGVAPSGTAALRAGEAHPRELVLASERRGRVRIGPRSWLRFIRHDGKTTPWFEARRLRVSAEAIVAPGPAAGSAPAPLLLVCWDEVARVEVNDLDLGRTVAGSLGGAAAVMTAAMVEAALIGAIATVTGGHVRPSELGLARSAFESVVAEAGKRPPDAPAETLLVRQPALIAAPPAAQPLFSAAAIRRDFVRFAAATEVGAAATWPPRLNCAFVAVARIRNGFEVGGGLRLLSTPAGPEEAGAVRVTPLPLLRLGWHLDLDARRRVALPLLIEGALGTQQYVRLIWGVRVRLTDRAQLGIYPWNPVTWTRPAALPTAPAPAGEAGYLTSLDLAWVI
jgi:hypothetical protein